MRLITLIFILFPFLVSSQQNVAINSNGAQPDVSAILDVQSTTQGMLIPRMDSMQRNLISSPATGLLVFDTSMGGFQFYNGSSWIDLTVNSSIADTDNDTKIDVETISDEDIIRFHVKGNEYMKLDSDHLSLAHKTNSLFIGKNTGITDDGNNFNTLVGEQVGSNNASGSFNVSLGYKSLENLNGGNLNTIVGTNAAAGLSNGSDNVIMGYAAGRFISSGNDNVILGRDAGKNVGVGSKNVYIGNETGFNNTGSGNVFIGNNAGSLEIGSNRLHIHNEYGSSSLISGEFDTRKVIFNGSIKIGQDTLTQQNSQAAGTIRFNEENSDFEGWDGSTWTSLTKQKKWGNSMVDEDQLISLGGTSGQEIGYSVGMDGDYAIFGAPGYASRKGRAYIYLKSDFNYEDVGSITGSETDGSDRFGISVDISGDYAIIGAYLQDVGTNFECGAAYIFKRNGNSWIEEAIISASDATTGDRFGNSVRIDGDYAIIGAPNNSIMGNLQQGASYIFKRSGTTWTEEAILEASDGISNNKFGTSVSIDGDYAVVSSPFAEFSGFSNAGKIYVFKNNGSSWVEEEIISASDASAGDAFGSSIHLKNNVIACGAPLLDIGALGNVGQVYIFNREGVNWIEEDKIVPSFYIGGDKFGSSVCISDLNLIVGAPEQKNSGATERGASYLFKKSSSNWIEEAIFKSSTGNSHDHFGNAVSIKDQSVLIGAFEFDANGQTNSGAVFHFYN